MTEARKTATFAAVAFGLALLAWATAPRNATPDAFQDRGTSFFPGFTDPTMARSLEVVDFDAETATAHPFKVQVQNELWTIPSHYDYPSDGEERLAKTAAAIIALKKDNVATENVSDHERTGTLDPLDETLPTLQGRGTRVTIKGDSDRILADVIIGKVLEGRPAFRYVRLAGQSRVYVAEVGDLDISTQFADWIDRDLLRIEWADVDQMIIRDYSLEKATQSVKLRDTLFVQKVQEEPPAWTMRDMRPGEEVDTFRVNLMVTSLDELSIIGVRPKPPSVSAGLAQLSGTLKLSQGDLADLSGKGFHFTRRGELLGDEGEVLVHTKGGVFFRLWFGAIAYGDVEPPAAKVVDAKAGKPAAVKPAATKASAAPVNRYVIISASFDPTSLSGAAVENGKKRAAALQARFAPWYFVVAGQNVERIRLQRPILIKAKSTKAN
jgi:hypothetical protein